jgi:type II secretory pathway pseudopilin PulG
LTPSQTGYALTEVLVAAAIAGAVLAAGMTAFAAGSASLRAASAAHDAGLIARNIEARLSAGLSPAAAIEGYEGWAARLAPMTLPSDPVTGAVLSRAEIAGPDGFQVSVVIVDDGVGRRP